MDLGGFTGLTQPEADRRLKAEGANELPSSKRRSFWAIAWDVAREPMFLLLLAAGAIYFLLGDLEEALLLMAAVIVVIGITLYQERKTERALEALRDLSSPRALVIRDGVRRRIPGREVVRGDILVLAEGDRVPADAVLLTCVNLSADESLLTGESVPVRKGASNTAEQTVVHPGGDDLPFVYSGTLIVRGQGVARAQATGLNSELGKIGRSLQLVQPEDTLLQKETRRLVKILTVAGLCLCVVVAVLYGRTRGDWLTGFLAGVALAMSMLPEEFPVVLTIYLALGAWRISRKRVLTRRMPAVEILGSATVLCVDKTGTLTENRMSLHKLATTDDTFDLSQQADDSLPEQFHSVVEYSILASSKNPFDPMETAFNEYGRKHFAGTEHLHPGWRLLAEYPLSRQLFSVSRAWATDVPGEVIVAAKGAPEAIARLCHLNPAHSAALNRQLISMASEGLRVLGVARTRYEGKILPEKQSDFDFEFVGLVGLADPIRPSVLDALQECVSAGIRVVMITGDYPVTAQSIARQIGLRSTDVITGPELRQMSEDELRQKIQKANVFARVVPEQKLRLVNALKANGEVVAMTGDGVNDAPALKSANIGIAMGGRGTDVAREAASLVLLDDDFSSIVLAVRLGRRIFDNLRKAMAYLVAIHVVIAGVAIIPVLFNWPLVLLPVHIVFLELIIDPACSIAFEAEPEEMGVMSRPPRRAGEPILGMRTTVIALLQGLSALAISIGVFVWALHSGQPETYARAMAFTTLIVANLSLIWTNRSWGGTIAQNIRSKNVALWVVTMGTLSVLGGVLYLPVLNRLFRMSRVTPEDLALCGVAGTSGILWFEILKWFERMTIRKRRTEDSGRSMYKRVAILIAGWGFIGLGILGLFLPVLQGVLFLCIGLVILSSEYVWARHLLAKARQKFPGIARQMDRATEHVKSLRKRWREARSGGIGNRH